MAVACAALAAALAVAEHGIDWIGLQAHWLRRAGTMALVIPAAALLYFGVLAAAGVRLRELLRRA